MLPVNVYNIYSSCIFKINLMNHSIKYSILAFHNFINSLNSVMHIDL